MMKIDAAGMKWDAEVTKHGEGDFSVFAETKDQMPYHHYCYDPLWEGDHEPSPEEVAKMLDEQVERDSESAWEARLQNYYSV